MISIFLMIFIVFANVIAILTVYHSYGKKMEKNNKIKNTLIIIGALYIATLIIYEISGIGVGKVSASSNMKTYMMMAFVPINVIILIPFSVYSFMKLKEKKIKKEVLNKRLLIVELVAIVLVIIEFFTFRGFQKNIKNISDQLEKNAIAENEEIENENVVDNIVENIVNNVKSNNVNEN